MDVTQELDRKIEVAQTVMGQLDGNQPLSSVLSQVRLLASMVGDNETAGLERIDALP